MEQRGSTSSPHVAERRLLVVEDDFIQATRIADVLEDAGYEIAGPVRNLHEAKRIVSVDGVDAAVLDLQLKGESTLTLAGQIVRLGTPVLFVTGHAADFLVGAWKNAAHLEKPFTDRQLVECVDALFAPAHPDKAV